MAPDQRIAHPALDDHDRWGPTEEGSARRRPRRRRLVLLPILVLLAVVVTYAGAGVHGLSRMQRTAVPSLAGGAGPVHVLVTGSDSRADLTDQERLELTAGEADGERTDTIFVLSVDGGDVGMLAFPRDLLVTRCDGSEGRINVAFQLGGPDCLVRTVQDLSGIRIDHYLSVDFLGFRDLVDAVGGVELCLEAAIRDAFAGVDLPAGCQRLTGRQALGFVRVRKIDNDLMRIQRQQRFLAALAEEITAPATFLNPVRTYRVAGGVGGALTADDGLGPLGLARLAFGLRTLAAGGAVSATVPARAATLGGAAVLVPEETAATELFRAWADGSALDRPAQTTPPDGTTG